ncbi:unnamed protein product [Closterium sp. Yama58-4]|nr:unnamed protein product [Closterium sp. Yama58-4]
MPYVPPHMRAGASISGSEPPPRTTPAGRGHAGSEIIDDYAERESSVIGTSCNSNCVCNGGKGRCNRMLLRFQPFKGRSYLHLQDQNLSLLTRVSEAEYDHVESPDIESNQTSGYSPSASSQSSAAVPPSVDSRSDASPDASASQSDPSVSSPSPIATPTSLFDAISEPLRAGLEAVYREMEFAARSQLRRSTVDRCKLVVRLGKLLFAPPFGSPESLLPSLSPFTAGELESTLNRRVQRLPTRVHRSLETGMPEPLFQAVENIVMAGDGVSACTRETYHIRVQDTEQVDTEYKLICKPDPDGSGVILVKVKHNPLRYAVIDVSRPSRAIDFRLMLSTDTRLCALDDATRSACERIASTAIIEGSAKGGLHWPITLDFDVCMMDPRSPSHTPSASSAAATAPSHRFRVKSVRHQKRLKVFGGGQVWKLSRVNGVEYDHGGGRLTNEAEFCLLAWRDCVMKRHAVTAEGAAVNGFRRVKLLVRLGKLLFSAHGNRNLLIKVPPFSAQRLEDYMSGSEQQLKLPIHRVFETHVPDSVGGALEEIILRDSGLACKSSEKYDIQCIPLVPSANVTCKFQVLDTWSRVIYRASCIYDAEKQRLFIKVKKFPVRYGVFEIARPGKALDVRLILAVETHLPTLDETLGAAFDTVLEAAQIDPQSPGGVRIPEYMIEGQKGFDVASMDFDSSSSASEDSSRISSSHNVNGVGSDVSSRFSANGTVNSSGGSSSSEESSRFQVRAVRHITVRKVQAEGRLWKFSHVDGIEYKQGGGRKTNIVEVCPTLWRQQLKGDTREPACSREQQQHPTRTSEHIIAECPALLTWLARNLP